MPTCNEIANWNAGRDVMTGKALDEQITVHDNQGRAIQTTLRAQLADVNHKALYDRNGRPLMRFVAPPKAFPLVELEVSKALGRDKRRAKGLARAEASTSAAEKSKQWTGAGRRRAQNEAQSNR